MTQHNFLKVRYIPSSSEGWDISKDLFKGSEQYGPFPVNDSSSPIQSGPDKAWAIQFDYADVLQFKVESANGKHVKSYPKANFKPDMDDLLKDKEKIKSCGGVYVFVMFDRFKKLIKEFNKFPVEVATDQRKYEEPKDDT